MSSAAGKNRWRRGVMLVLAALAVLIAVLVVRASSLSSRQVQVSDKEYDLAFGDPQAAAQRLARAVQFRTVSYDGQPADPDELRALHAHLEAAFPLVHQQLERSVVGEYSLIYEWRGRHRDVPGILVTAHQDVVPADGEGWRHAPFAGDIAAGFVWGRGAVDDKSAIVASLEAVERLLARGFTPERSVVLAFSHDEEIGGAQGSQAIAEALAGRRFAFALGEGSVIGVGQIAGLDAPLALIGVAEKGYATFELRVEVAGGHAARPPEQTAIGALSQALAALDEQPMAARLVSPVEDTFDGIAPEMGFAQRLALANRWLLEPLLVGVLQKKATTNAMVRTTMVPTILAAGVKENALPRTARAVVNTRILPGDSVASTQRHIESQVRDFGVDVHLLGEAREPSPLSAMDGAAYQLLARTIREVYPGTVVAPGLVIATTDAGHYAHLVEASYRFLPLALDTERIATIHGADERISVDEFSQMISFFVRMFENV
ncbi:M20/M25/M40 family metallo-hydrolase [Haliangium ochraceum]|uniref:Peptidase M20 n=1 Tax=Haliangium ochraceum (strain DSM 14365 / JCM 11303 / SMP-2) TaxID=502025 RepID=D0LMR8_HALO1|nr:M20/M25/M40 family metallo-hydrolase [Haliangium ochraceum]ACY18755.1 peptidase M20 [Haliangium ochraceum DSM 14365]